jgi:hypothetical protein
MFTKAISTTTTLLLLLLTGNSQAIPVHHHHDPIPVRQFENSVRKLWEDHIRYTRSYLVNVTNACGGNDVILERLLKNQEEIGNSIIPFYGEEAGLKLADLLKEHINKVGNIIELIQEDKDLEATIAIQMLRVNGNEIATFLSAANPDQWPLETLQTMLTEHIDFTLNEVRAEIAEDTAGSIVAYDQIHDSTLSMADFISQGIIKQFPDKFIKECFR